jgi:hypothetical protein
MSEEEKEERQFNSFLKFKRAFRTRSPFYPSNDGNNTQQEYFQGMMKNAITLMKGEGEAAQTAGVGQI